MIELPIFWISGPPAAGKTTLCAALLEHYPLGVHLPVDDMRQWVVSGLADAVPWTEETERQFQIAETAACSVARRYHEAGFAVAIDHCRNPKRLDEVIGDELAGIAVVKVMLLPGLEENLRRNRERTNKDFDPRVLEETIEYTNGAYGEDLPSDWMLLNNTTLTVDDSVLAVLRRAQREKTVPACKM